jgi:hypothetical protein
MSGSHRFSPRSDFPGSARCRSITRKPAADPSLKREERPSTTRTNPCADCPGRLREVPLEIPSRCILAIKVVPGSPSWAAAPFGPPITPLGLRSVAVICARSASAIVLMLTGPATAAARAGAPSPRVKRSAVCRLRTGPAVMNRAAIQGTTAGTGSLTRSTGVL